MTSSKAKKAVLNKHNSRNFASSWDEFNEMTCEQIEDGAQANSPGFKVVRKLLSDQKFDK